MRLLLWTVAHSALTVGGMGLLTIALGGRAITFKTLLDGLLTLPGFIGVVLLFGSFLTTTAVLSFAKLSVFVPLNTGLVFLFTLMFAVIINDEKVNLPILIGMALIVSGIAIISAQRGG